MAFYSECTLGRVAFWANDDSALWVEFLKRIPIIAEPMWPVFLQF